MRLVKEVYGRSGGGIHKASSSEYLLTGLLKCGLCGANLIIAYGKGRKTKRKCYACSQWFNRGACTNNLTIRQDVVERNFIAGLQGTVLTETVIDYATAEVARRIHARQALASLQNAKALARKAEIERELERLVTAIAKTGHRNAVIEAVAQRQRELDQITHGLKAATEVEVHPSNVREFVTRRLADLLGLLKVDVSRARAELIKHTREIRMTPETGAGGRRYYLAAGAGTCWEGMYFGVVAGDRNHGKVHSCCRFG